MRHRLDVTAPDLIAIVYMALDVEIECLSTTHVQRDEIVLLAGVERAHECHGVQREFEFGTHADEGRSHELLDAAIIYLESRAVKKDQSVNPTLKENEGEK